MPKMISGGNASLAWLIAITAALRLCFGWAVGLGVDESYMVAAGREVGLGYFDHPPVAWWLSRGAAWLFGTDAPIVVRLPFIALFALSTWLMARIGTLLADARVGFFAALLLNRGAATASVTCSWAELGLKDPAGAAAVRDLWARKDLGSFTGSFTAPALASHASMLVKVKQA